MATGKRLRQILEIGGNRYADGLHVNCHVPRGHHVLLRPTHEPAIGAMEPGPVRGPGPGSRHSALSDQSTHPEVYTEAPAF